MGSGVRRNSERKKLQDFCLSGMKMNIIGGWPFKMSHHRDAYRQR